MTQRKSLSGRRLICALSLTGLVLAALAPAVALADAKPLGVIDSGRIAREYPAARDAQELYEKFIADLETEVAEKERDLQRLLDEIESQRMLLGEDALAAKTKEFEDLRADYFRFRENADTRAAAEYEAGIGPIIEQVKTIAERIGKEDGFGMVIDATGLTILYIDDSVDLTDKILSALMRGEE